jgi:hypothetical protein
MVLNIHGLVYNEVPGRGVRDDVPGGGPTVYSGLCTFYLPQVVPLRRDRASGLGSQPIGPPGSVCPLSWVIDQLCFGHRGCAAVP